MDEETEQNQLLKGILYKRRDLFTNGWRPRYFILEDNFLHCYLDSNDVVPKHTLDLSGCSVSIIMTTIIMMMMMIIPILVTIFGIVTDVNFMQPLKALVPSDRI